MARADRRPDMQVACCSHPTANIATFLYPFLLLSPTSSSSSSSLSSASLPSPRLCLSPSLAALHCSPHDRAASRPPRVRSGLSVTLAHRTTARADWPSALLLSTRSPSSYPLGQYTRLRNAIYSPCQASPFASPPPPLSPYIPFPWLLTHSSLAQEVW